METAGLKLTAAGAWLCLSLAVIMMISCLFAVIVSLVVMGTANRMKSILGQIVLFAISIWIFQAVFDACRFSIQGETLRSWIGYMLIRIGPVWRIAILVFLVLLQFCHAYMIFRAFKRRITRFSVGEAISKLPVGLSFSSMDGQVMQYNRIIDELCYRTTGSALLNAEDFWNRISSGYIDKSFGYEGGEKPLVTMPDGRVWMFMSNIVDTPIGHIRQILCADATKEQEYVRSLRQINEELDTMNAYLRSYNAQMEDVVRTEQLLETKKRVHDNLGSALLAARIYLTNEDSPVTGEQIIRQWDRDLNLLLHDGDEEESDSNIRRLMDAAQFLGLALHINGTLPDDFNIRQLICVGIQECMTNAVQHADADVMYVNIEKSGDNLLVSYTNDGKPQKWPFKEGGGLTLLRKSAERMGASVSYLEGEHFHMLLTAPLTSNMMHMGG